MLAASRRSMGIYLPTLDDGGRYIPRNGKLFIALSILHDFYFTKILIIQLGYVYLFYSILSL